MEDNWFRHAIAAMVAGLAWFLAAEAMYRFGVERISPDLYMAGDSPLLRLWILQLTVYFIATVVASTVCLRVFFIFCRTATLHELLPGIALAGTLRFLASMDAGLMPHPVWFDGVRLAFLTLLPLAFAAWMIRLSRRKPMID